jgi:peptide/nickel transport system permease protein
MLAFIIKRLANAVFVMLSVTFLAFVIFTAVGDPVDQMLNEQATQAQRDDLRERLGLDDPFLVQYGKFVARAATGDFGISFRNQRDVMDMIGERFPATFELVLVATFISLIVGVPMGVITAIKRQSWYAEAMQFTSIIGVSLPSFVVGIGLILVFSVWLGWFPAFGRGDTVDLGWWSTGLLTSSGRMSIVLPALSLSLFQITLVMRLVRAEMLEVLRSDFIKFARARGVPARSLYFRHALRNCLMPVVTMTAMQIGGLIAFALVTETVFQWPGMGLLFIQAVTFVDVPIMAAYLCIVALIFVVLNAIVDMTYVIIDPRLKGADA